MLSLIIAILNVIIIHLFYLNIGFIVISLAKFSFTTEEETGGLL